MSKFFPINCICSRFEYCTECFYTKKKFEQAKEEEILVHYYKVLEQYARPLPFNRKLQENPLKKKIQDYEIYEKKSNIFSNGETQLNLLGVYSKKFIKKNTLIGHYNGIIMSESEFNNMKHNMKTCIQIVNSTHILT